MLVFDELKCAYQPVCKVATNSFYAYFANVLYDLDVGPGQIVKIRAKIDKEYSRNIFQKKEPFAERKSFASAHMVTAENVYVKKAYKYENYYKFAFVRNPWSRAVAAFRELLRRYPFGLKAGNDRRKTGLKYCQIYDLMNGYVSFENFVDFIVNVERNHSDIVNPHWRSQSEILMLEKRKQQKKFEPATYNFVGKLENINKDFSIVQRSLGLEKTELFKQHVTVKYDYKLYYQNSKTVDMVGEYYKNDIENFTYEF